MKIKEYMRLAWLSIKENKKSTRSTIIGLVFGFVILVPVLVLIIGFNGSVNTQLNKVPYVLFYNTSMADYRINTEDTLSTDGSSLTNLSGSKHLDKILDNSEGSIVYEQYRLPSNAYGAKMQYAIDGSEYTDIPSNKSSSYSIVDIDKSDNIFPTNLVNNFAGGIYVDDYAQGFSTLGKKEVIVSENFLTSLGLLPKDVYNKTLTIKAFDTFYFEPGIASDVSGYLCKDYLVKGIIKAEVSDVYSGLNYMDSNLFFTSPNVYNGNEGVLKPRINIVGSSHCLVIDNIENKDALNEEYMMLGWSNLFQSKDNNDTTLGTTKVFFEENSFEQLDKSIAKLQSYIHLTFNDKIDIVSPSEFYDVYKIVYQLCNILSYVLLVVALVLVSCSLLNMYNTIRHSVKQRGSFLMMMRAIGTRKASITKMYMAETGMIMSIANAIIFTAGLVLSTICKYVIAMMLKVNGTSISITLSWGTIFATLIISVLILYSLSMLIAYLCTRKLAKSKINDVLSNN